jgi:hypothetical protein
MTSLSFERIPELESSRKVLGAFCPGKRGLPSGPSPPACPGGKAQKIDYIKLQTLSSVAPCLCVSPVACRLSPVACRLRTTLWAELHRSDSVGRTTLWAELHRSDSVGRTTLWAASQIRLGREDDPEPTHRSDSVGIIVFY